MPEPGLIEAQLWLNRARDDLGAAAKLLRGNDAYPATASYHCQQAAEKALKAVLATGDQPIPKTHDLRVLVERAAGIDPDLLMLQDIAEQLTPLATEFRYPSDVPDPTRDEARRALNMARELFRVIAEHMGARMDSPDNTNTA
ncbi:HEPN domain-containing protein [Aromatoleum anaerobium]|uniref:HEPN domain-containing protein n=1 Tax=Aromatoleum anaerobium TaxID=182180 RepID=A0ABX1PFI3_9RHOO|nr:HEPN domain-containing protein [Aromatoleum anaerobium]MCK0509195.1 HEPN domain-containing protein [Aromatoleum anaerobium]